MESATAAAIEPVEAAEPAAPLCKTCGEPAVFQYSYEWGETGYACAKHVINVQQTATNTRRQVQIVAVNPGWKPPITRDERTRLVAERLVACEERDEANGRSVLLHNQVVELSKAVQRMTLIDREKNVQLQELRAEVAAANAALRERETQLAAAGEELGRLRLITEGSIEVEGEAIP